jgi:hypothetical protein
LQILDPPTPFTGIYRALIQAVGLESRVIKPTNENKIPTAATITA